MNPSLSPICCTMVFCDIIFSQPNLVSIVWSCPNKQKNPHCYPKSKKMQHSIMCISPKYTAPESIDRSLETFFSGISPLRELCPAINNFMKTHTQVGVIYFVFTVAYSVSFRKSLLYLRDRSIVVPTNKVELC